MSKQVNIYDFDGVTSIGVTPRPGDIIITGRTIDEYSVVFDYLKKIDMLDKVMVYFNTINYETRGDHTPEARLYSAIHKASIIKMLLNNNVPIGYYFEDDPLQLEAVLKENPSMTSRSILIPQTVQL